MSLLSMRGSRAPIRVHGPEARGSCGAGSGLCLYPVWFLLRGPQHYTGAPDGLDNPYHGVAFGPVLPTTNYRFGLPGLSNYGHLLDGVENGQYLGVPLLILASLFVVWFRRHRGVLIAATLAIAVYVLSLGDHLSLLTLVGSYPLPFVFVDHLPLLNNLLPVRLTLYTVLFVAVIVGLGTAQLMRQRLSRPGCTRGAGLLAFLNSKIRRRFPGSSGSGNSDSELALPFLPDERPGLLSLRPGQTAPPGSVVLTYPFPYYPSTRL